MFTVQLQLANLALDCSTNHVDHSRIWQLLQAMQTRLSPANLYYCLFWIGFQIHPYLSSVDFACSFLVRANATYLDSPLAAWPKLPSFIFVGYFEPLMRQLLLVPQKW